MNSFTVEYFGQAAHGAYDPWNGRSALDGVELLNYGVNMMREHIEPSTRIHYVITEGGDAPNVVPEYAKVWYYVRDLSRESVERYYQRILKIAEGAALATGTTHKVTLITGVHECLMNRPMQEAIQANLEMVGDVAFTAEEQEFGKSLQRFLEIEEKRLRRRGPASRRGDRTRDWRLHRRLRGQLHRAPGRLQHHHRRGRRALAQLGHHGMPRHQRRSEGRRRCIKGDRPDRYRADHRSRVAGGCQRGFSRAHRWEALSITDSRRARTTRAIRVEKPGEQRVDAVT